MGGNDYSYSTMKFKIEPKLSLNPECVLRFIDFWETIKKEGFKTSEDGIIECENEDLDKIAEVVKEKGIEMKLIKIQ